MRFPRKLAGALALSVALSTTAGCTDPENALLQAWQAVNPFAAEAEMAKLTPAQLADGVAVLDQATFDALSAHVAELQALPRCELYDLWIDAAGLPANFHNVMRRESGPACDPNAHNRSGATGLLQIMPMWADDCGTTVFGLFDPKTNILCGVLVYRAQGAGAWSQTWRR